MRLFVAVTPPGDVLDLLDALPRPTVAGVRWTTRDQWHVTLRFLGSVPDDAVPDVAGALTAASMQPCTATLGPAVGRFGQRVLQVPVDGLSSVADAVVGATAGVGEPPDPRPFTAHLTLARSRGRGAADLRPLAGAPLSATWPVDEVRLYRSELHPHGARYTVVHAVALPSPS